MGGTAPGKASVVANVAACGGHAAEGKAGGQSGQEGLGGQKWEADSSAAEVALTQGSRAPSGLVCIGLLLAPRPAGILRCEDLPTDPQ